MKKLLLVMLATFMSVTYVNAENVVLDVNQNNFETLLYCTNGCGNTFEEAINDLMEYRDEENYKYYAIVYIHAQNNKLQLFQFNDESYTLTVNESSIFFEFSSDLQYIIHSQFNDSLNIISIDANHFYYFSENALTLIDTNFDFILQGATYEIQGFYNDSIILKPGYVLPTYLELKKYNSWSEFPSINIKETEVNLDNYEYVLLNLKDYSKKDSFSTIMKVKGSIGITPIYEYGTVEKNIITDICNISYEDYTNMEFFILKNDLINSAIYAVKGCEDGSSFKYDSSIFDITYVTAENVNDPVVTIGGVDYHTIPFNQLSNTVNKNTEEGFIPGESEGFNPIGSLTNIIDNITSHITSFWNSLSSFMSLVTKFFNTLPIEIRSVAITSFTIACTLGLLKILKS